jgi:hypothetical protein
MQVNTEGGKPDTKALEREDRMPFGSTNPEPEFYARIVKELEEMAEHVRHRPEINHKTAARLEAIAKEIREDAKLGLTNPPASEPT